MIYGKNVLYIHSGWVSCVFLFCEPAASAATCDMVGGGASHKSAKASSKTVHITNVEEWDLLTSIVYCLRRRGRARGVRGSLQGGTGALKWGGGDGA